MKKSSILLTALIVITICLSLVKAVLQNSFSTSGIALSETEREINLLKSQNAALAENLFIASSLTNIDQKARQSGFINENNVIILGASRSLAVKP